MDVWLAWWVGAGIFHIFYPPLRKYWDRRSKLSLGIDLEIKGEEPFVKIEGEKLDDESEEKASFGDDTRSGKDESLILRNKLEKEGI